MYPRSLTGRHHLLLLDDIEAAAEFQAQRRRSGTTASSPRDPINTINVATGDRVDHRSLQEPPQQDRVVPGGVHRR